MPVAWPSGILLVGFIRFSDVVWPTGGLHTVKYTIYLSYMSVRTLNDAFMLNDVLMIICLSITGLK